MKTNWKIAIVCPASIPWMGLLLDGVRRYSQPFGGWRLYTAPLPVAGTGESIQSMKSLIGWGGDAVIAAISSEEEARDARSLGIPVLNISSWSEDTYGLPRVCVDNFQAGRLAADHLVERGLMNLAYVGWKGVHYSEQRMLGFVQRGEELGVSVTVRRDSANDDRQSNWGERLDSLGAWLSKLPHPCGVFAVHDYRAQLLIDACDNAGLRVPQDVAIIGMDDDVITCEHSVPTLSSVSRNSEVVGWESAALIDRILTGEAVGEEEVLISPDGVIARQSTDTQYHADHAVQVATQFMTRNLGTSFNIEEVARHAGVSKRTLETRFRARTGKSPHQFLTEARIGHAEKLIARPGKKTLGNIAMECGYSSYTAFFTAYQKITGRPPSEDI